MEHGRSPDLSRKNGMGLEQGEFYAPRASFCWRARVRQVEKVANLCSILTDEKGMDQGKGGNTMVLSASRMLSAKQWWLSGTTDILT